MPGPNEYECGLEYEQRREQEKHSADLQVAKTLHDVLVVPTRLRIVSSTPQTGPESGICMEFTHNATLSSRNKNHIGFAHHHRKLVSTHAVPVTTYSTLVANRVTETSTTYRSARRSAFAMAHQPRQPLGRRPVAHTQALGLAFGRLDVSTAPPSP
jgi:hypothetical protein